MSEFLWPETGSGSATGDVVGPGSATDNAVARFDGTTGKLLQNSLVTVSDTGDVAGVVGLTASSVTLPGGNVQTQIDSKVAKAGDTMTGLLTLSADPSNPLHAATKQYVDSVAAGLDVKASVIAATTANITLSAPQTIDGVSIVAGNRVLVKNQSTASQNGIYVAAAGAWTRSTDMDSWLEVPGAFVFAEQGTLYADTGWVCTADAGGTIGTTSITWSQFAGAGTYSADGNGIELTGTQFSLELNGSTLSKSASGVQVANGGIGVTQLGSLTSAELASKISDETGSGALVFATSPTLVTPALGTPASGVATNITGLPIDAGTTGTLPISRGGTGQTAKAAAYDALSPNTTLGDLEYYSTTNTRLAGNTNVEPAILVQTGNGTVSAAPVWRRSSQLGTLRLHTGNGYGSTNNKIKRFTTAVVNTITGLTYADSATLGGTFTITEAGIYSFSYTDAGSTSMNIGISLNSSQLTTAITTITTADRLCLNASPSTDISTNVSITLLLAVGDVIRMHTDGTPNSTSPARTVVIAQRLS